MGKRQNIVVLTGAGISAESGLQTFRDANGLWRNHRFEDVASPEAFARNPSLVHEFYNLRRTQLQSPEVAPNAAHLALARLEREWRGDFTLITQNVDDLHERGGSRDILHMHGELLKARCVRSGQVREWRKDLGVEVVCPCCGVSGALRPHIVWFGEIPFLLPEISRVLSQCDVFVAIGTSGVVYPAAGFVQALKPEVRKIEMNREASAVSDVFDEHRIGLAGVEVPRLVEELLLNPPRL